mmetsp:Transcript_41480/g.39912  ORF Transcript_41480/g.39912 Transcript_41480/m.39912 type:complete len:89 (+) Transcript_41480:867-1133(+)
MSKFEEAEMSYKRSISMSPTHKHLAYFNIGNCFYMKKDFTNAIHYYQQSLSLSANNKDCNLNLANAYAELKEYQSAIKHLQLAIELDP